MRTIKINEELYELLYQLIKERRNQNTYGTETPIYLVQTRVERIVDPEYDEVDVERLYLEGYTDEGYLPTFQDIKEGYFRESGLPIEVIEDLESENNFGMSDIISILDFWRYNDTIHSRYNILSYEYEWKTVAYFLSLREAERYQRYQSHNLGVSRVYADYVGYRNSGLFADMLRLLDSEIELIEEEV